MTLPSHTKYLAKINMVHACVFFMAFSIEYGKLHMSCSRQHFYIPCLTVNVIVLAMSVCILPPAQSKNLNYSDPKLGMKIPPASNNILDEFGC